MSMLNRLKNILDGNKEKKSDVNSYMDEENSEKFSDEPSTQLSDEISESKTKTPKEQTKTQVISDETKSKTYGSKIVRKEVKYSETNLENEVSEEINVSTNETKNKTIEDEISEPLEESEEVEEEIEDTLTETEEESEEESKPKSGDKMSLLKQNEVMKSDAKDKEFSELLKVTGSESLEYCFQCGTCTGSCPSGRRTPYKIRQIVRKANIGLKEELLASDELWMCTTCYSCQERCPRGLKIVEIVKAIRNEAAKAGFMAPAHKATGKFVINFGHGVPINDATKELRKKVGLDEIPPTTHKYPEALDEIQKIVKATGFDALIGFNWEKGDLE